MGKKKRGHPDVEEVLARPWCYYCERDFDDLKILISHQKAKHFKCERCGRRLNTAGGLSVHMNQVHKETLTSVDNALPNRSDLSVEIFGMEGIPEDIAQAHNQRIIQQFYQAEAERRAATGNPGPGNAGASGTKKPKFESPAELKKRLAEHKARMADQAAGGGSSGANTPMDGVQNAQSPAMGHHSPAFNGSPFPPPQTFGATQGASHGSFSQDPYAQPVPAYQQPYAPPQPSYSPPGQQYPSQQPPYSAPQPYPPQQSFAPPGYGQGPPGFQSAPSPQGYSAGSPGGFNPYQPTSHSPPPNGSLPARPPSLPAAPGLPQRPSFSGPPGNTYPPQPVHQGPPGSAPYSGQGGPPGWNGGWNGQEQQHGYPPQPQGYDSSYPPNASSVDDLVSSASRPADDIDEIIRMAEAGIRPPKKADQQTASAPESATPQESTPAAAPEVVEKKPKKDKNAKMVYSDNEVSPEEKMAQMPRYAFVPDSKDDTALVEAAQPAVAGTVDE